MTKIKKYIKQLLTFPVIIILCCIYAFTVKLTPNILSHKPIHSDSIAVPEFIKRQITYSKIYPFIRYNQNYVEWQDFSAISGLFEKLKQTPKRKLKILHIGDSHVQADIFTGYIRNELQDIFGYGGRGSIFPYAAAATHAAYDYKTSCKGKWDYSRNVQPYPAYDMGITGATIHTEDTAASFKLVFNKTTMRSNFNVLKLYCKRSPESFDLKLKASGITAPLYIDCNTFNEKLYIEIKLPTASDTLEFFINKTDTTQKYFECYGLLSETTENNGILYNSVGINGAGLSSILKENLLFYQLSELKPDLVVLDLGLNDFYKVSFNSSVIEKELSNIIDIIQSAAPDASIILSDGQDVYYRYWDEANCKAYASLMREVAFRKGCAFYDYYYVAGGQYSMIYWLKNKLARYDKVHLTPIGYITRGELFTNAFLNSYYSFLNRNDLKTFIAAKEFPDTTKLAVQTVNKKITVLGDTNVTTSAIQEQTRVWKTETYYYQVKSGDNLGAIACLYGVTVKQVQLWNGLQNNNIMVGKTLIIYKQKLVTDNETPAAYGNQTNAPVQNQIPPQTTVNSQLSLYKKPQITQQLPSKPTIATNVNVKGAIRHTVKSGDNLWSISKKYGVSVEQIKKLNKLPSNALKLGMVLIIKN